MLEEQLSIWRVNHSSRGQKSKLMAANISSIPITQAIILHRSTVDSYQFIVRDYAGF
jgi:hypothetical protein